MDRKLEIGSGLKPRKGYEHLDIRQGLPDIDHVHDFLKNPLPFDNDTFTEVLADNVFEHVPWIRAQEVLIDWIRVLEPGGKLRIIVPDFEAIVQGYINKKPPHGISESRKMDAKHGLGEWSYISTTIIKLFGGQDYAGNYHFAGYDETLLRNIFQRAGLTSIIRNQRIDAVDLEGIK